MSVTPKEFAKQLRRFAKYVEIQESEWEDGWEGSPSETVYNLWDRMHDCDCFGTEGQLDPRGDRR